MNISHEDLAGLYRSYLSSRIPPSRRKCPETGELWRLFDPRISETVKSKLLGHIGQCSYCSEDFLALLEIRRATRGLEDEIETWRMTDIRRTSLRTAEARKRWQFAFLMAGSFILAAALFAFIRTGPFSARPSGGARARERPSIELLRPSRDAVVPKDELRFVWRNGDHFASCILELYDSSLARIWKSGVAVEPEIVPPSDVIESLVKDEKYYWMITGFDPSGRAIESDLRGFRISD